MKKFKILTLFALMLTFNFACAASKQQLQESVKYIDFELPSLTTTTFKLSNIVGKKLVLLNFWATWCPYCVREIPQLKQIYETYKDKGLEIVAVNLGDSYKEVASFAERYNIRYTILLDQKGTSARSYMVQGIPTNFLIDLKGNIIFAGHHLPDAGLIEPNLPKLKLQKKNKTEKKQN